MSVADRKAAGEQAPLAHIRECGRWGGQYVVMFRGEEDSSYDGRDAAAKASEELTAWAAEQWVAGVDPR